MSKLTQPGIVEIEVIESADGKPSFVQPDWFDEAEYLLANPDVNKSIASGDFPNAYHHYVLHGRKEGRPLYGTSSDRRNSIVRTKGPPKSVAANEPRCSIEAVLISPRGGVMVVGWVDDISSPLEWIRVACANWHVVIAPSRAARFRRQDVEGALGVIGIHSFGFFAFIYAAEPIGDISSCMITLHLSDGRESKSDVPARRVGEDDLRNTVLTYIAEADLFGNRHVEAVRLLRGALGASLIKHNRDISKNIVAGAHVERFGPRDRKFRGSLVVCLYGKPEYLFLQNALFAGGSGFEDYEMVYVSNSPELSEKLMKDMHVATQVYGLTQTLVLLPGNAGFGAANNAAVNHASSDRILVVNPDVFPRDEDWARKHSDLIANVPKEQTQIFGVPLYYDDGSLMHGGMHFECDTGLVMDKTTVSGQRMIRVEHYGKGAPPWSQEFTQARPVPAITGAFMSLDRSWYEKLGGFTEDFIFGHYEDADLCLKSITQGVAPWMHDIKLWHLEGKGSTRLPVHEGGSYVNRGIFLEKWEATILDGLVGRTPSHPLFNKGSTSKPSKTKTPLTFPKAAEVIAGKPKSSSAAKASPGMRAAVKRDPK